MTKEEVTYHDPCHLGRDCGVYEEPRKLLTDALQQELVEMPRNRQFAWCCGSGGGVKSAFPEWSVEIATKRVEEAKKTGAKMLTTACPFCKRNLGDAIKASGIEIELYDIMELVSKQL